jgi:hypothetical protein
MGEKTFTLTQERRKVDVPGRNNKKRKEDELSFSLPLLSGSGVA